MLDADLFFPMGVIVGGVVIKTCGGISDLARVSILKNTAASF
jgi:hypothetical protein